MSDFLQQIKNRTDLVKDYIRQSDFADKVAPNSLKEGVLLYPRRGGKLLRPAIMMLACEAVGGDTNLVIPAAAAMELSHTWTLVHDDIIDNDDMRRKGASAHAHYRSQFKDKISDPIILENFSKSMAILVGDLQQAWATNLLNKLNGKIDNELFNYLVDELTAGWLVGVLEGEALDVEYAQLPIAQVTDEMIINMLTQKTASTFAFAGKAGALIGLDQLDLDNKLVQSVERACLYAGIAFQIKDDVLGVIGDEDKLGKPVGSDIKEGKRTLLITHAYAKSAPDQQAILSKILGKADAGLQEIETVKNIIINSGSIEYVENLANNYIDKAKLALGDLPESQAKDLLNRWVDFMTNRVY